MVTRCRLCRVPINAAGICADFAACNVRRWRRGQRWRWLFLALLALPGGLPVLAVAACVVALLNSRKGRRSFLSDDGGDRVRSDS